MHEARLKRKIEIHAKATINILKLWEYRELVQSGEYLSYKNVGLNSSRTWGKVSHNGTRIQSQIEDKNIWNPGGFLDNQPTLMVSSRQQQIISKHMDLIPEHNTWSYPLADTSRCICVHLHQCKNILKN